jgi:hypothetical protein
MRRASLMFACLAAVMMLAAPSQARAEGFVSPWLGVNFGNDPANGRAAFGASAGYMGAGIFGAEFDFGYSPSFFGTDTDFGSNNVMTAMGNLIVGIPIGGTTGGGLRPYVTGGIGLIRTDINGLLNTGGISNNDFGFNLGGGFMAFFNNHFGMRGDVRYFRNANDNADDDEINLDLGGFDFWRAYVGVVIR